jgi:hypothetical protein
MSAESLRAVGIQDHIDFRTLDRTNAVGPSVTRESPKLCQPSSTAPYHTHARVDRFTCLGTGLAAETQVDDRASPAAQNVTAIGSQIVATPTFWTPRSIIRRKTLVLSPATPPPDCPMCRR